MIQIMASEISSDFGDVLLSVNLVLFMVILVTAYFDEIETSVYRTLKRFISLLRFARLKRLP